MKDAHLVVGDVAVLTAVKFVPEIHVAPVLTGVQAIGMLAVQVRSPKVSMTLGAVLHNLHTHADSIHSVGIVMLVDTKTKTASLLPAKFALPGCTKMNTENLAANRVQVELVRWNLRRCGNVHASTLMPLRRTQTNVRAEQHPAAVLVHSTAMGLQVRAVQNRREIRCG